MLLKINLLGGKIDYAELLNQKSIASDTENTVLLNKSPLSVYEAQTGLIGSPGDKNKYPNHMSLFEIDKTNKNNNEIHLISSSNGLQLKKIFKLSDEGFNVNLIHEITNLSNEPQNLGIYFQLLRDNGEPAGGSNFYSTYTGPVFYSDKDKFQKVSFSDIEESNAEHTKISNDGWLGIIQHYYVAAWLINNDEPREFYSRKLSNNLFSVGAIQTFNNLNINEKIVHNSTLYVGPQEQETLRSLSPGLDLVVDYGILTLIAKPIFWLLDQLHGFIGNWGWAIVLLTIIIKLIFYPLTAASYRSMAKMKGVTPKIMQLREQYKNDKMKLNQSMMELYKKEKINPLGGCLPILIQIPVFISLYWVLLASVEIKDAPWIFWIKDLSSPDPFYILPLIMAATMFIQMKLNPTPPDPLQAKIMMMMPIVFSIFFFFFPSGLVLYWLVNNVVSIAQQWSIMRQLNVKI